MKSMKFIIMLLIFAILLSTLVVAISAATETLEVVPTVTLDGIMDEKEGWDKATVFDFAMHVQDGTGSTFVKREDRAEGITGSSSIRFRNDNDYLYIYYETSNSDTLDQPVENGGLILRIVPQNNVDMQMSLTSDGTYMHLWLNVANSLGFTNTDTVGSIYDFTFTDMDHTAWGLGVKTIVNQFGFSGWYDSYSDYSSAFAKNTTIALHVEKDADNNPIKKAYEIKMPLGQTYKSRLGSNEPTFYFSAYERSHQYNGTSDYTAYNAGYLISLDGNTPVSYGHSTSGAKANSTVTNGIPVTLTKIIDPNAPAETTAPETTTKAPETTKAPATTTKAPATTTKAPEQTTAAATTAVTEEKSGCGSSIALTSIALVTTVSASVVFVRKKRKDD